MVWEDNNLVVEGEVESSDEESDVPQDDFDIDSGDEGEKSDSVAVDCDKEEESGSGEEEEDEESGNSEEEENSTDKINEPIEIGEGDVDQSDESGEDDSGDNESDDESKDNDDEHETDEEEDEGNVGWADAMSKVLAMGKNSVGTVSILSKAKKDNVKKTTVVNTGIEGGSDGEQVVQEKKYEPLALRKARKRELDSIGRKRPDVLERNAEKTLAKIATRGVVQLFNAVRDHQKDIKGQLKEAGGSFRKQENVFKNMDKNGFVETLTGKSMSKPLAEPPAKKPKSEVKEENDENQSTWNILRDDFMLGAKMRDWDKESDGE
eukprot:GFUD01030107.1.p1 GENE.GFUD01030107.1~~GFUD01030107.1.p1  ORF type:complete len:321 (+),score=128.41 GFUD01030107.1:50-1012(+)